MDFGTSKKIVVIFKRAASVIEMGPIRCPGAQEGMHLVFFVPFFNAEKAYIIKFFVKKQIGTIA